MVKQSQGLYKALFWPVWVLFRILHPVWQIKGRENLPKQPYILVANHSAATDPIYITLAIHPKPLYRTMAKKEIVGVPVFGKLLCRLGAIAVDREGDTVAAVISSMKALRAGQGLLIFPEGTRRKAGKEITPKSGPVVLSARCQVPLVPIYLSTKKHPFSKIKITFGQPYTIESETRHISREEETALASQMLDKCYALGEE